MATLIWKYESFCMCKFEIQNELDALLEVAV